MEPHIFGNMKTDQLMCFCKCVSLHCLFHLCSKCGVQSILSICFFSTNVFNCCFPVFFIFSLFPICFCSPSCLSIDFFYYYLFNFLSLFLNHHPVLSFFQCFPQLCVFYYFIQLLLFFCFSTTTTTPYFALFTLCFSMSVLHNSSFWIGQFCFLSFFVRFILPCFLMCSP